MAFALIFQATLGKQAKALGAGNLEAWPNMIKLRPYVPSKRIAIRDSSIDEDISDDVDDEVFIKDARSAKRSEEQGLKRPLMAPRRKNSSGSGNSSTPIMKQHKRRRCCRWCEPFCYGLAALTVLCALLSLAALMLTLFPLPVQRIHHWWGEDAQLAALSAAGSSYGSSLGSEFVPCTQISVQRLWTRSLPRMNSESPLRAADLNGDGIRDVIFGYGVDDNIHYEGIPLPRCKSAQQGDDVPCEGGVVALNGRDGSLLWQTWSVANVFSLHCNADVDRDGGIDCLAAGRLGMIFAINGRTGQVIWNFHELEVETNSPIVMDLYTINVLRDLDGDEVPELIAAHLEEREESKAGHIKLISGKTGKVLRSIPTPHREEMFVPIQLLTQADGTELLLMLTGGQNTPGGIYSLRLLTLMAHTSEKHFIPLHQQTSSGLMVPAVLSDLNGDGISDIVVAAFNSSVYAYDGHTYGMLWNYTFPASECVSAIVPGHFDRDNVTDFMVKYNTGPGFPVYYYSQTTILDGRTGQPLLDATMTDAGGASSLLGGVSISQSFGGDFFLHWQLQCRNRPNARDAYEFVPDSDIILQARADTCRLRYNESMVLKLFAIARHIEPPGAVLFSTDDLEVHLNRTQRPAPAGKKSPLKHPKLLKKLLANREQLLRQAAIDGADQQQEQPPGPVKYTKQHHKHPLPELLPENELPSFAGGYIKEPYKEFKDYEPGAVENPNAMRLPEEYELVYNDELPQLAEQNERPIHLRSKYPSGSNRDVRSGRLESSSTTSTPSSTSTSQPLSAQSPLSLWDLELDNEAQEQAADAAAAAAVTSSTRQSQYRRRKRQRRNEPASASSTSSSASTTSNNASEDSTATPVDAPAEDWYLASISSTGVLLKALGNVSSSLDFAFVLNIRESEAYPPLFSPQDLSCVEEKISAYKSYTADNLRVLRKQFLKQCLSERLVDADPALPKYEAQLIITRIGITCTCRTLQPGEVCSELDPIEAQRWTEFMGNDGNGYYAN
ncbi:uncharacterized protein [Drosophila virilis]|uniref:Uncharacterized protein, isoform A n=1 Tax=Drosophila virilis TaxID=7244 RepID=B4M4Q1_DROVI|nr:uncharacterized protein LOC6632315 isoform X1 [Drosophila virilis]EDW59612.1 uncharacterized protein Dvir_GJ10189, isoform A [Drosophila virilis]KRF78962.1 uncharacterized protein Dvir_GJ10189, isoform C [Drosophila virilis]